MPVTNAYTESINRLAMDKDREERDLLLRGDASTNARHQNLIHQKPPNLEERYVVTSNYTASYRKDLNGFFIVLDELASEARL